MRVCLNANCLNEEMKLYLATGGSKFLHTHTHIYMYVIFVSFLLIPLYDVIITGHTKQNVFSSLCVWVFVFQGEKECLNSETTELKQKIRYLQDQLLPLSKQREYQEKEIQRLNRVSVEPEKNKMTIRIFMFMFEFSHFRLWKKP